jgi:hypothetical protein
VLLAIERKGVDSSSSLATTIKLAVNLISHDKVTKDFTAPLNQTPETLKKVGKYIKAES